MFTKLRQSLFKEKINGESVIVGGLDQHIEDERDFEYKDLGGWFDYKPKHERLELKTANIKTQYPNNTCVFHSYASCREVSEGVALSPRSIVLYAKNKGLLRADGRSSLREGQKAGIEFGIAEEKILPNESIVWNGYINVQLSDSIKENANIHKARSYFTVSSKNEWLKALDDGYAIHTGFTWYSSYNMTSGLKSPWILPWKKGYVVDAHAVACIGYDTKMNILIFQNSFGNQWGDNGKFYVRMNDFFKDKIIGMVSVDLTEDKFNALLKSYEGKNVKTSSDPAIFLIKDNKKRAFPNEITYYAFGNTFDKECFTNVANSFLSQIENGENLKPEESPYWNLLSSEWNFICWMKTDDAIKRIKQLLNL